MIRTQSGERTKLEEYQAAIRKLIEVNSKVENLIARKLRPDIEKLNSVFVEDPNAQTVEDAILGASGALVNVARLARKREKKLPGYMSALKRFQESGSVDEIKTLIGLTALGDYRDQLKDRDQIVRLCQSRIYPGMPKMVGMLSFAGEMDRFCRWLQKLLNYDDKTQEDDITRLFNAVRIPDLRLFNSLYEELMKRIQEEESSQQQQDQTRRYPEIQTREVYGRE